MNTAQAAAAAHAQSPLLIIAGAGTGKTLTLTHRVAHLVKTGLDPHKILLLTFTRRAAQEMLDRAANLLGSANTRAQGGTFHGIAHRILRKHGPAAGLPADFSIMDSADAADLMAMARSALGYDSTSAHSAGRFPKADTCLKIWSRHINTHTPVPEIVENEWPRFNPWISDLETLFAEYSNRKSNASLLDYDDLLLALALLLEHGESVADNIRNDWQHVLVDEYQDTNPLQARILKALCPNGHITAVGDDAQSIYSFRGATINNIMTFPEHFRNTTIVTLEQNYRSTAPILHSSNTLISRANQRYSKTLWTEREGGETPWLVTARDEREQTKFIVNRIIDLHENEGLPLKGIAVLIRAGSLSADLEIELTHRRIPYEKWGGLKFLEAAHIKDMLAFLRILENPQDEVSWFRILRMLPGVGEKTASNVIKALAQSGWIASSAANIRTSARASASLQSLAELFVILSASNEKTSVSEEISVIRTFYDKLLQDTYDDPAPRLADLEQLAIISAAYNNRTEFLAGLALEPPAATQDLAVGGDDETDALIISTIHSAKGREWDAVFVPWLVDGVFPMARSADNPDIVEEERRLLYVAMTRARNTLCMLHPLESYPSRYAADYSWGQLSRFIDEGVRRTLKRITIGADARPVVHTPQIPSLNLKDMLRLRGGS